MLKVGQLAKQAQLSVRTLHHYDEIGLLSPSARTASGHRLYNDKDIALLHRIQALKQFGFPLREIVTILRDGSLPAAEIIQQQIAALDEEIHQALALKQQLLKLQYRFNSNRHPETRDWLDTLALMSIYQRHLTSEEMSCLDKATRIHSTLMDKDLPELVVQFKHFSEQGISPDDERARALAEKWLNLIDILVDKDPDLLVKLDTMTRNEKELQYFNGIQPATLNYLYSCVSAVHKNIHAKYLTKEELDRFYNAPRKPPSFWPALIADIRHHMRAGLTPESDEVRVLAHKWQHSMSKSVHQDSIIASKLRTAYMQEPLLTRSTGMNAEFFEFVRKALNALPKST